MKTTHEMTLPKAPVLSHVPDQLLVKVRQGQIEKFVSRISVIGLQVLKRMHLLAGDFVVVKTAPKSIDGVLNLLGYLPEVEYAELNYTTERFTHKHHLSEVVNPWEKFTVKEAAIDVIDSKIDLDSPRIESEIKVNRQKISHSKKNNFVDITINDLLFLSNAHPVNLAEAVEVIDYATKMDVNIVSNSWVRDGFSRALDDAIKVAEKKGVSFVAAASIAASIGSSMGTLADFKPVGYYDSPIHYLSKPVPHVSAGILNLYIAQEGKDVRTGRGRLIAKSFPTVEQIENEWRSSTYHESAGKSHPKNEIKVSQDYSFPGAKFIKLEIEKLNSATNLNLIKVKNSTGILMQNVSNNSEYYETDYVETSLITIEFHSNTTSTSIGAVIRNVRVIY